MIRRQSRPGRLDPVAQADSLTLQKELVAAQPGLYSILGPYSIAAELRDGRLQASRLVRPDLVRHVTLALPRHGKLSPACRVVALALRSQVLAGAIRSPNRDFSGQAGCPASGNRIQFRA